MLAHIFMSLQPLADPRTSLSQHMKNILTPHVTGDVDKYNWGGAGEGGVDAAVAFANVP